VRVIVVGCDGLVASASCIRRRARRWAGGDPPPRVGCLHGTLGEPLRDREYFSEVRVDDEARTIVWPNGLDPAPELLHGDY
jgi:hypothetical protein